MKNYIIILILINIFSCTKEIEVELPEYSPEVVVDGWISTNDYANILLTRSSPFFAEYDSASIRDIFLNYAKITLNSSDGESEILTLFKKDEFFPPFVYKSVTMRGASNETYSLTIEVEGDTISSETTLTENPVIDSVSTIATSDTTRQFAVYLNDDAENNNYYYLEIKVIGQDTNFHPAAFPLYTDDGKNGEIITLKVYRSNQPDPLNLYTPDITRHLPEYEFHVDDPVYIKVSSIDETSYKVLNDLYITDMNSDNPFSFINNATATNINGGIGRWTGMASETIYIP